MPKSSAWRASEHRHRGLERQHAAFAHPVLESPDRVATVGVALRVRAGVAPAELGRGVRDELAEPIVVGAAHRDRELRLEVVADRDVDHRLDGIQALRVGNGREVAVAEVAVSR